MENILYQIRRALKDNVDEKTLSTGKNYFKEEVNFYGVKIPVVNEISKQAYSQIKDMPKSDIFALCEQLWQSGYTEESYVACNLSYYIHRQYEPDDFAVFERWVHSYVTNWASCDTLCNHTIGTFIEMYPSFIRQIKAWVVSSNRWVKRAAAVSFVVPARKGMFLSDIFDIADMLLMDRDDMVQKGYGWMLKAAADAHRSEVFDYIISKKMVMPRIALRYAIEKMPQDMKAKAMAK